MIAALLLFGRASDLLGRRPMLFAGLVVSALFAGGFLIVGGLPMLLLARLLSGLPAGVVMATATVALVELVQPRRRASAIAFTCAVAALSLAALVALLRLDHRPARTHAGECDG